jgi:hypothetical protein
MKKGQVIGQVFIYLITAVIIGVVLIFGVQAIMQLVSTSNDVRVATFQKDFVTRLNSDFGYDSVDTKPVQIPGDFREICFIELGTGIGCGRQSMNPPRPLIEDSWKDCVQQNIFVLGNSKMLTMYVEGLKVNDNDPQHLTNKYVCSNITGGVVTNLAFKGYGSGVVVERK